MLKEVVRTGRLVQIRLGQLLNWGVPCFWMVLDAFLEGATATVGTCTRLTGSMLLHLWAMAFLKWPKFVTQWASVVSDAAGRPGVSAGSLDVQAEFFASKSVELACHCDMDDMPWMHEQISVGLQNVLLGPVFWLDK